MKKIVLLLVILAVKNHYNVEHTYYHCIFPLLQNVFYSPKQSICKQILLTYKIEILKIWYDYFKTGNSRVLEPLKATQHTESQTDHQKTLIITTNKMVQTESTENINRDTVTEYKKMAIRTIDECLAVFKTQVK